MRTLSRLSLPLLLAVLASSSACERSVDPTEATAGTSTNNASLTSLIVSRGTLSPTFTSNTTAYTVPVQNDTTSITVTPTSADPAATITVNGGVVASGTPSTSIGLPVGTSIIGINVTSADATVTRNYNIAVTRAP
jgi:hypothetical protein